MKKIWIIDDDDVFHLIIRKQIEIKGHDCDIRNFLSGEKAINYLKDNLTNTKELPQLIMLDINMPIMDGWQFLGEYEKLPKQIRGCIELVLISCSIMTSDRAKAEKVKCVHNFINKPITSTYLDEMLTSQTVL